MIVFSPLSLYTTYLGWQQYDVIFDALWQTGLLYVGFLMLGARFLKNILAPSGAIQHAADNALTHFLFELATLVIVCSLFVYPCVPLEQKGLSFKPMCTNTSQRTETVSLNDTGTTYDEAFADVLTDKVRIPLGFSLLQNLASSMTYALMKSTGCSDSLQAIQGDLVSTYIPTNIRMQALKFHRQCFLEARHAYLNEAHDAAETQTIDGILKRYGGEEDLTWLGSKTFSTLYYKTLRAREPVAGFSYVSHPSANFESAAKENMAVKAHLPENGYPTCEQWWKKIKSDLVKTSEHAGVFNAHLGRLNVERRVMDYKAKHRLAWHSDITPDDYIAKVLLHDSRDMQLNSAGSLIDSTNSSIGTFVARGLVNAGQSVKSWTSTPLKREATLQTLPVMQSFFYFFLIIFTPLILALSGYSLRALGSLCALFFMAIFIQYIWHSVSSIERSVLDPMGESDAVDAMRNMALLFYGIAPIVLLKLSSHFGGEGGAGLIDMIGQGGQSSDETVGSSVGMVRNVVHAGKRLI